MPICIPKSLAFYHIYQLNAVFNSFGSLLELIFNNNEKMEVECSLEPVFSAEL